MGKWMIFVAILATLCSCGAGQQNASNKEGKATVTTDPGYLKPDGDSVSIPSLLLDIQLSEKASDQLIKDKESVVVDAWFSGHPKDTSSKEYRESGGIFLKAAHAELDTVRSITFRGLKFSKHLYDSLADKDIRVLVNIYSGRKTGPDNILDCGILAAKVSVIKDKRNTLSCRLINEADSLK